MAKSDKRFEKARAFRYGTAMADLWNAQNALGSLQISVDTLDDDIEERVARLSSELRAIETRINLAWSAYKDGRNEAD